MPEHASLEDPVVDLRAACRAAVTGLGPRIQVVGGAGARVGHHLVRDAGAVVWPHDLVPAERAVDLDLPVDGGPLWCGTDVLDEIGPPSGVLVVANGSAKRTEKAPGHFDERAEPFDELLRELLVGPDPAALRAVDLELAEELWADAEALPVLGSLLRPGTEVDVTYDGAPYGVQYWVISYR
nr:hypothetical protein [Nocardioides thalensis]